MDEIAPYSALLDRLVQQRPPFFAPCKNKMRAEYLG
jgi:hypothetical protein